MTTRRPRPPAHGLVLLAVLAAALVGCSSDPTKRKVVTTSSDPDASGDVLVGGLGPDRDVAAAAPRNAVTDILGTTVDHGVEVVTVEVTFRDLRPRRYLDLTAYVTTDRTGSRLPVQATALVYRDEVTLDLYDDDMSRCTTADAAVDRSTDTLTMTLPRSCMGHPRWIEAEVIASTMRYNAGPDDPLGQAVWEDHAYGTGRAGWDDDATTPRLHHP
ncbi:hypothetical protein IEZ26_16650 [Nocardioides cavernae]|uniref:Lipoprotein n=1 Tax=Nocardioides cavernae TaxID=1921566 RepID=A0ABR8NF90_9ACTN|nr:hypothetical protein [Nocardioides cavernae]MBD3926257.1 hypothetical protein [Nocardioides cavernae]MBM7513850.1 hypothetical protein [Nocardioides cavernae]